MGANAVLFPTLLPLLRADFHLDLATVGVVFPINSVGALIGGLVAGAGSDRVGRKPFLLFPALFSAVGMGAATLSHSWVGFVVGYLVLGVAQGAFSITVNAVVMDVSSKAHSKALNYLHGCYSLGAMLSPIVVTLLFRYLVQWRMVLAFAACNWILIFCLSVLATPPATNPTPEPHRSPFQFVINPLLGLLFMLTFFYNGTAWVLIGWVKTFLQAGNYPPEQATLMLSVFYCALTIGRFGCASFAERWGYRRTLMYSALGALLVYPLIIFSSAILWIGAGVFLCALFLAPLYPTAIAYGTQQFAERRGAITGLLSMALSLGSTLPPYWTGWLGKQFGLAAALRWNYALLFPLFTITLFIPVLRTTPSEK